MSLTRQRLPQGVLGVVDPRFDRARGAAHDRSHLGDRQVFQEVQGEHLAMLHIKRPKRPVQRPGVLGVEPRLGSFDVNRLGGRLRVPALGGFADDASTCTARAGAPLAIPAGGPSGRRSARPTGERQARSRRWRRSPARSTGAVAPSPEQDPRTPPARRADIASPGIDRGSAAPCVPFDDKSQRVRGRFNLTTRRRSFFQQ
jgi:hypothetical protein